MDWMQLLQANLGELIILIGGSGIIYWRETKRGKSLDNDGKKLDNNEKVIVEWKEMYHEKEKKCTEKDQIIVKKDDKIEKLRKEKNELLEERYTFMANRELELKQLEAQHAEEKQLLNQRIAELERENAELRWNECRVNGCPKREPPRDRKCLGICPDCKEQE